MSTNAQPKGRKVEADAYTQECFDGMKADYFEYIKKGATTTKLVVIRGEGHVRPDMPRAEDRSVLPRSVRIREGGLEQFGFAAGCPGCAWYTDKLGPHIGHSMKCREIHEELMRNTEESR